MERKNTTLLYHITVTRTHLFINHVPGHSLLHVGELLLLTDNHLHLYISQRLLQLDCHVTSFHH